MTGTVVPSTGTEVPWEVLATAPAASGSSSSSLAGRVANRMLDAPSRYASRFAKVKSGVKAKAGLEAPERVRAQRGGQAEGVVDFGEFATWKENAVVEDRSYALDQQVRLWPYVRPIRATNRADEALVASGSTRAFAT